MTGRATDWVATAGLSVKISHLFKRLTLSVEAQFVNSLPFTLPASHFAGGRYGNFSVFNLLHGGKMETVIKKLR
ncbi:hypothetical protein [Desulfosarcina sp.]|uniref:hypothetical protein n=1 Tax=Desulfosarcina sp. TaxID=2027861 RepID=UPI0039710A17